MSDSELEAICPQKVDAGCQLRAIAQVNHAMRSALMEFPTIAAQYLKCRFLQHMSPQYLCYELVETDWLLCAHSLLFYYNHT